MRSTIRTTTTFADGAILSVPVVPFCLVSSVLVDGHQVLTASTSAGASVLFAQRQLTSLLATTPVRRLQLTTLLQQPLPTVLTLSTDMSTLVTIWVSTFHVLRTTRMQVGMST